MVGPGREAVRAGSDDSLSLLLAVEGGGVEVAPFLRGVAD